MATDVELPHSLEAEVALLGAMMLKADAVETARRMLSPADFYRTAHRVVFEAACAVDDAGSTVDAVTVLEELVDQGRLDEVGGAGAVHDCVEACATPSAAGDYAKRIATLAWRRRTAVDAQQLQRAALDPSADLSEALEETVGSARSGASVAGGLEERYPAVDWQQLWTSNADDVDWLVEELAETGRAAALYAPGKTGKSLVMLELAVCVATGRPFAGLEVPEPRAVLYLDFEMSPGDVLSRLRSFGVDPGGLDRLAYLSLPMLPPLDTADGGRELAALVDHHEPALVVLDTYGRAVEGPEDEADTVRDYYRHTGLRLKAEDVAVWRIDHAGKDPTRGQRGSSAKNDDVDAVWKLTNHGHQRWRLALDRRRTIHGLDELHIRRGDDGLLERTRLVGPDVNDHLGQLIADLDRLEVPPKWGRTKAGNVLRDDGVKARNQDIVEAQKVRQNRTPQTVPNTVPSTPPRDGPRDGPPDNPRDDGTSPGRPGTARDAPGTPPQGDQQDRRPTNLSPRRGSGGDDVPNPARDGYRCVDCDHPHAWQDNDGKPRCTQHLKAGAPS